MSVFLRLQFDGELVIDGNEIFLIEKDKLLLLFLIKLGPQIVGIGIHVVVLNFFDSIILLFLL